MEEKLLEFIRREYISESSAIINKDTKLLSTGIIDSFSLVSFLVFVEKEFGKKVPVSLITPGLFDTVSQMAECISRLP